MMSVARVSSLSHTECYIVQADGAQKQEHEDAGDCHQPRLGIGGGSAVALQKVAHPCVHSRSDGVPGHLHNLPPLRISGT